MEFSEVVERRRMVRHFSPDPIDRAVLERIAATAQRAPSAGFSQGQRLVIVTDPERRARLAQLVGEGLSAGFAGGDFDGIRAVVGLPEHFTPVGVIPIGRPLPDKKSPSLKRGKRTLDEFARWETW